LHRDDHATQAAFFQGAFFVPDRKNESEREILNNSVFFTLSHFHTFHLSTLYAILLPEITASIERMERYG
jgi:hypothetical protein